MTFYNTLNLFGDDRDGASKRAATQNEKILQYFKANPGQEFTPGDILAACFGNSTPLTSIRRAISTLTKEGKLVKTATKRKGPFGAENYCWTYAKP
jgi:Fe2+ or Zn2+ uptake regulation protein